MDRWFAKPTLCTQSGIGRNWSFYRLYKFKLIQLKLIQQQYNEFPRRRNNTTPEDPFPNSQFVEVEIQAIYMSLEYACMKRMKTNIDDVATNDLFTTMQRQE